jgi:nucleoid-associated protein YgaU
VRRRSFEENDMGLIAFVNEAGEKLLGRRPSTEVAAAPPPVATGPLPGPARGMTPPLRAPEPEIHLDALAERVEKLGLGVENMQLELQDDIVIVTGEAATQSDYEKIVLVLGNTQGVAGVDNRMTVKVVEPPAVFYTVAKGDTLSKIAKDHYGNANKYNAIFEANKPMLKHPDKFYPGQVLRIPPAASAAS